MLTAKQEKFAHNIAVLGMTQHGAYINAYSTERMLPATIDNKAYLLVRKGEIRARIAEKQSELEGPDIMNRREMLAKLTTIARTKMSDFATCSADGVWLPDYGPESLNSEALKKIKTTTMPFKGDEDPSKVLLTEVELHDPLTAMRDICKIKGYWAQPEGTTINNDNRSVNIYVETKDDKEALEWLKRGHLPEKSVGNE